MEQENNKIIRDIEKDNSVVIVPRSCGLREVLTGILKDEKKQDILQLDQKVEIAELKRDLHILNKINDSYIKKIHSCYGTCRTLNKSICKKIKTQMIKDINL